MARRAIGNWLLVLLLLLSAAGTVIYVQKTYRTFLLLQSAQELGIAEISSLRGWMTPRYLAETYGVDEAALLARLGQPAPDAALKDIATSRNVPVFDFVVSAQKELAMLVDRPAAETLPEDVSTTLWGRITDWFMTRVLSYGVPILFMADYLGSLGLPVPAGPVTALAGSLAASDKILVPGAFLAAVLSSWLGDITAFAVGRLASPSWIERRGKWFGLTPANHARATALFAKWGGMTVILAMSIVSQVSSVVGVLAGVSRLPLSLFLGYSLVGRLLWTSAYFGLGYVAGANFSAASGFLFNLGMSLLFILAGGLAAYMLKAGLTATGRTG
jgi:membrane protein DedA with SNARE-associated domain